MKSTPKNSTSTNPYPVPGQSWRAILQKEQEHNALKNLDDLIDSVQDQQPVAAKAAKTVVGVSTDPTDTPALPQEQKDTPSVIECNSFLQILEERVCKTIHKDFRESGQVCTSKAASDIL